MFELSIAYKYLIPRWRQLSVSIISLVSTLVIALVVWLIVVFFSVKDGLETGWIDKITGLTAPIRITPTEQYYHSYYYLADTISQQSNYNAKTIGEKILSPHADPYNASIDEEPPQEWQSPDRDEHGNVKDLVKLAFLYVNTLPGFQGIKATDFETTVANLRLRLLRNVHASPHPSQQFLEHASLVGSFDADTPSLAKALINPTANDFNHLLHMQAISSNNIKEQSPNTIHTIDQQPLQNSLKNYFDTIEVVALKTPAQGWRTPPRLLSNARLKAIALLKDNQITKLIVPSSSEMATPLIETLQKEGGTVIAIQLKIDHEGQASFLMTGTSENSLPLAQGTLAQGTLAQGTLQPWVGIYLAGETKFHAKFIESSLNHIKKVNDLQFEISGFVQGHPFKGNTALGSLEIHEAKIKSDASNSILAIAQKNGIQMPSSSLADTILLPKSFRESGALIGDQGYLAYYSPTPSTLQEQRIPIQVAGFYDPGIIPIGGKYLLAERNLTALIRASYNQEDTHFSNGINVRFTPIEEAPKVKRELEKVFQKAGIAPYWKIETYQEYEFSKDILQQLQSEKNLFSLISLVIIIVACSNIISMLIILVNDKKLEIGILRSMGASSASIACIFGICGMVMGAIGSLIGIFIAVLTLRYVNELVGFMSRLQGHDLFNPIFYGSTLPTELSLEALLFVMMTTVAISLFAGIIPAFKASMMRPSAILRAE